MRIPCTSLKKSAHLFYEEGKKAALKYERVFGKGNFFLELQDHGLPEQKRVNMELLRLSQDTGIELVATNDVHYTYAEDEKSHDILLCIQTGKKLSDENRMRYEGGQYYVKSEEEMKGLFPYAWEAVENTQRIADRCNVDIEFGVTKLPHFEVPVGFTSETYLYKLCYDGLKERYGTTKNNNAIKVDDILAPDSYMNQPAGDTGQTLKERLDYELGVIKRMGYVDYFLIVWDFINYARNKGIPVGPGRGSAAGSIVAYCLHITNIDPIKYSLLFERFLNPERVSMPDIDIDFCFERRQEVIDYVGEKYGADKVVQIVTFGTMAAKGVIRDVGRVMDLPYAYVDGISKMIPNELNITIEKALDNLKSYPDIIVIFDCKFKNLKTFAQYVKGYVEEESALNRVVIQVFNEENVLQVREVYDFKMLHVCMMATDYVETMQTCIKYKIGAVSISNKALNERFDWGVFEKNNVCVFAYTVNTVKEYQAWKDEGITGVFSDFLYDTDVK